MRLYDMAKVVRSKNAGPFTFTIDLVFPDVTTYERVLRSASFGRPAIGALYGVAAEDVLIHPFAAIRTIKVAMPRRISSGSPGDVDVYGSQQHFPLADLEIG